MTKCVLITGCSRGIGLAFAKHYLAQGWRVIGGVRNLETAEQLQALQPYKVVQLDVADEESICEAAGELKGEAIDLLINNAGIFEKDSFADLNTEDMMRSFRINAMGPLMVTRAFLPHLEEAALMRGTAKVCQISSRVGSLAGQEQSEFTGYYGYKLARAAENMFTSCFAWEHKKHQIIAISLDPGCVLTDMATEHLHLPLPWIEPEVSVAAMASVLEGLTLEDSGKFLGHDGEVIPW